MSDEWTPGEPWIQYSGSNGTAIAERMTNARGRNVPDDERKEIFVNPEHSGPDLSLSQRWPNGTVVADRWRVPVGYWINPASGECADKAGRPQDWDALTLDE